MCPRRMSTLAIARRGHGPFSFWQRIETRRPWNSIGLRRNSDIDSEKVFRQPPTEERPDEPGVEQLASYGAMARTKAALPSKGNCCCCVVTSSQSSRSYFFLLKEVQFPASGTKAEQRAECPLCPLSTHATVNYCATTTTAPLLPSVSAVPPQQQEMRHGVLPLPLCSYDDWLGGTHPVKAGAAPRHARSHPSMEHSAHCSLLISADGNRQ